MNTLYILDINSLCSNGNPRYLGYTLTPRTVYIRIYNVCISIYNVHVYMYNVCIQYIYILDINTLL